MALLSCSPRLTYRKAALEVFPHPHKLVPVIGRLGIKNAAIVPGSRWRSDRAPSTRVRPWKRTLMSQ